MSRKILFSPGYGAGWSSWMGKVPAKFACEYEPIIVALENGAKLTKDSPCVVQFVAECKEKFGEEPYLGGLGQLEIEHVEDGQLVRIEEYDGSESVLVQSDTSFF